MLLKVTVKDETGKKVPCRLDLFHRKMDIPLQTTFCDGMHIFAVPEGEYAVKAARGLLYRPAVEDVRISGGHGSVELRLNRMIDPTKWGMYSFDAHSHVSRDDGSTAGSLALASLMMRCEDFNFFFAGSPYEAEDHYQYLSGNFTGRVPYRQKYGRLLRQLRSKNFITDIGNEIYKGRYGHAFMMNYDQKPPYSQYYDESFDPWQFEKNSPEPDCGIPYMHEALLKERTLNSAAIIAHPTSWWHEGGQFITNIAATLGFEVLAGSVDAMTILGYQPDSPAYQALWFELLDNGYFIPGIAETDNVFDREPENKLRFKTYAWLDSFTIDALADAVRKGRCVASSGPLLSMRVDGHLPGSVLPFIPNQECVVTIDGQACCEGPVERVQILVNGKPEVEYHPDAMDSGNPFSLKHAMRITKNSYILVKCYDSAGNTAVTNPVFFRNEPFINDHYQSSVHMHVTLDGLPCRGQYRVDDGPGFPFAEIGDPDMEDGTACTLESCFTLMMNPSSTLHIEAGRREKTIKLFEMEALQEIFRNLYLGGFNRDEKLLPGQVPAEAFQIQRIRELLDDVFLSVEMNP